MQTSGKKLSVKNKKAVLDQFFQVMTDLGSIQETKGFLSDFMTETELLVFAKRLAIAQLLTQGKSYQEIKDELKVSSATISTVSDSINKPGIQVAQQKIALERWAEKIVSFLIR